MATGTDLPTSETLGIFLGVSGIDWLADGYAEPLRAAGFSLAIGLGIFLTRLWLKHRRKG